MKFALLAVLLLSSPNDVVPYWTTQEFGHFNIPHTGYSVWYTNLGFDLSYDRDHCPMRDVWTVGYGVSDMQERVWRESRVYSHPYVKGFDPILDWIMGTR